MWVGVRRASCFLIDLGRERGERAAGAGAAVLLFSFTSSFLELVGGGGGGEKQQQGKAEAADALLVAYPCGSGYEELVSPGARVHTSFHIRIEAPPRLRSRSLRLSAAAASSAGRRGAGPTASLSPSERGLLIATSALLLALGTHRPLCAYLDPGMWRSMPPSHAHQSTVRRHGMRRNGRRRVVRANVFNRSRSS